MPLKRFPKAASLCFMNIERTFDIHKVGVNTTSRGSKGTKFPRKIGKMMAASAVTFANLATVSTTELSEKRSHQYRFSGDGVVFTV